MSNLWRVWHNFHEISWTFYLWRHVLLVANHIIRGFSLWNIPSYNIFIMSLFALLLCLTAASASLYSTGVSDPYQHQMMFTVLNGRQLLPPALVYPFPLFTHHVISSLSHWATCLDGQEDFESRERISLRSHRCLHIDVTNQGRAFWEMFAASVAISKNMNTPKGLLIATLLTLFMVI